MPTDDQIFPMLWQNGATNTSVTLLHMTLTDGSSVMKLRINGFTNLEGQGGEGSTEDRESNLHKAHGTSANRNLTNEI